jgi:hypothetical protein
MKCYICGSADGVLLAFHRVPLCRRHPGEVEQRDVDIAKLLERLERCHRVAEAEIARLTEFVKRGRRVLIQVGEYDAHPPLAYIDYLWDTKEFAK